MITVNIELNDYICTDNLNRDLRIGDIELSGEIEKALEQERIPFKKSIIEGKVAILTFDKDTFFNVSFYPHLTTEHSFRIVKYFCGKSEKPRMVKVILENIENKA